MSLNIFNSAAWQLILQSDWVCRLVLLGLFVASVFCTAITIYKIIIFSRQILQLKNLLRKLKQIDTFQGLIDVSRECRGSFGGNLLHLNLNELKNILEKQKGESKNLTNIQIEKFEFYAENNINSILEEDELYLPALASSAAASPLVGLFGTIWGLIHSFIDIGQEKSVDISTVAPGLAEALITTLAGLIVAIPALIAYHYLTRQLHKIEVLLADVNDRFKRIVIETLGERG